MTIKTNLADAFSKINTIDELKEAANAICAEVKEQFSARYEQILKGNKQPIELTVEVQEDGAQPEPQEQPKATKGKKAKATETPKVEITTTATTATDAQNDVQIAITDEKAVKKLGLTFSPYSEKCWVLRGDTKPLRKVLKNQFKGTYNSRLNGGEGWIFRLADAQNLINTLGKNVKIAKVS